MSGMNKFEGKDRRQKRRENHIARDLRTPKCRQRRVEEDDDDWDFKDYLKGKYDDA